MEPISKRWLAMGAFALYSALNYLDRQTLSALAPQIMDEFHLSNEDYGWLQSAFYAVYAVCSPFAGLLIDRIGLSRGAVLTVSLWSLAAASTGISKGFGGLVACRLLLGVAESGAIPAFAKASATYLPPNQRALGAGLNQVGLSTGSVAAPLLAGSVAAKYGWRTAFAVSGLAGLLWIPLWKFVERRTQAAFREQTGPVMSVREMLRDRRLYALIAGNMLIMTVYSLWTHWTTLFLVQRYHLTQESANQGYAWIPQICGTAGGLFGGWLAMKWMSAGATVMQARSRSILTGALVLLAATVAVPLMPGPALATIMVSFSFFWSVASSSNMYALPQDLFGPRRTGFAVAGITSGYGWMTVFFSPLIGRLVDSYGFVPVCQLSAVLPLAGWVLLRVTIFR
ncbi:MAG TPA: MFS transporter [Bryobacteraceae bacterium]|nr:MFS transporter [Bryobacteraceae bacterium]